MEDRNYRHENAGGVPYKKKTYRREGTVFRPDHIEYNSKPWKKP
jgi:hypothetical protein